MDLYKDASSHIAGVEEPLVEGVPEKTGYPESPADLGFRIPSLETTMAVGQCSQRRDQEPGSFQKSRYISLPVSPLPLCCECGSVVCPLSSCTLLRLQEATNLLQRHSPLQAPLVRFLNMKTASDPLLQTFHPGQGAGVAGVVRFLYLQESAAAKEELDT